MAARASCGAENPEGQRFCGSCAAPLAQVREQRKTVTVVFCDVVGSTPRELNTREVVAALAATGLFGAEKHDQKVAIPRVSSPSGPERR